ncbi:MAG: carbohydrate ABC transporter permease [Chloroflexota bacterium]
MASEQIQVERQQPQRRRWDRLANLSLPYLFVAPSVLTLAFLMLYPILRVIYISLWENYMIVKDPKFAGFENFSWLVSQRVFPLIFSNTMIFTFASVILHLALGLGLAVLLSAKINPRARSMFRGLLILPWMFTAAVVALNWRLILNPFGIFNALLAQIGVMSLAAPINWFGEVNFALPAMILINFWRGYPFVMLMLLAALQSIPVELYEAASVDGAGGWAKFIHVTIPNIKPVIASVGLLDAIWNFRLFDLVYLTTGGGPLNSTHVLATYTYQLAFERYEFGKASALAVGILLFTSVLTYFYFRYQKV